VKPFLLLATRAEDAAADNEYESFLAFSGLPEGQLRRLRLEQRPLGEIDLDDWSAILLGGGPFNASDPPESKSAVQHRVERDLDGLLTAVLAADFPFLGACYGVGTVGAKVGAGLDRRYAEPVGPAWITLTAAGRADPLFEVLPERFEAFVGHKEAVSALPPAAVRLAGSEACPVQAFRVGRNVYATQFHPELDLAGLFTRIDVYKHAGYFPPEQADELKAIAGRSDVVHPPAVLRRFVARYGTPPAPAGPAGQREPIGQDALQAGRRASGPG
jgi:GMP synthase (glutamine-hydrolysing)